MSKWNLEKILRVFFQYCRKIYHGIQFARLKNKKFSLIANNCNGGFILHDLGLQFRSPFVNLYINPNDYIYILENLPMVLDEDLIFIKTKKNYPVAKLGNALIYFVHYSSECEAREKWNIRKKRIDWNNLFILYTERPGTSYEMLQRFNNLPYSNKIALVASEYPELKCCSTIKGCVENGVLGDVYIYISETSIFRYLNQFDFVRWFNGKNK